MRQAPTFLFLVVGFLSLSCSGGSDDPVSPSVQAGRPLSASERALTESHTAFGIKLLQEINQQASHGDNLFLSPFSCSTPLLMAYNGADGETKTAMERTLELGELTIEEVNEGYRDLVARFIGFGSQAPIEIATSIWIDARTQPAEAFLEVGRTYYDTHIASLDFLNPKALGTINSWVDEETHGRIPAILDEIPGNSRLYLIDTIWFKGQWVKEFDPELTVEQDFHLLDGTHVPCEMMVMEESEQWYAWDTASGTMVLDLPYSLGDYSMAIVLPDPSENVNDLIERLTPELWDDLISSLWLLDGIDVYIPRFRLESDLLLNEPLEAMGMGIAFSAEADFSGMMPPGAIWISRVIHSTFVEVSEEGTEAVGASGAEVGWEGSWVFRADRPFLFAIRHRPSGAVLFMGKVADPT